MSDQVGLLADIRRRREALLDEQQFVHLSLPYWPNLALKYERIVSRQQRADLAEKVSPELDDVTGEMEIMLAANIGVTARDADGIDHVLVGGDGEPLTLRSPELATKLAMDAESPAELILQMFSDRDGRTDVAAVAQHADRVAAWMDRTSREVDVRLVGERDGDETLTSSPELLRQD